MFGMLPPPPPQDAHPTTSSIKPAKRGRDYGRDGGVRKSANETSHLAPRGRGGADGARTKLAPTAGPSV